MPSVVWDVRSALVDIFTAALTVPAYTGPQTVQVFDGPQSRAALPKVYVLVGTDGGETGSGEDTQEGMSTDQGWSDVSNTGRRNENGSVTCSVWAWSGSTKFSTIRTHVDSVVTTLESTLLTNRKLPAALTAGNIELARVSIRERHVEEAAVVRAVLSITYFSRLN